MSTFIIVLIISAAIILYISNYFLKKRNMELHTENMYLRAKIYGEEILRKGQANGQCQETGSDKPTM